MKILDYLEKVQSYPEHKRRQILLVTSLGLTIFIIMLWAFNLWLLQADIDFSFSDQTSFFDTIMSELANIKVGVITIGEKIRGLWR